MGDRFDEVIELLDAGENPTKKIGKEITVVSQRCLDVAGMQPKKGMRHIAEHVRIPKDK